MAYLLTHHDPYHLHALLGLTALLHFLYRLVLCPLLGWAGRNYLAAIALHMLLSSTSFFFRIPVMRNSTYTIYREMQLHTIVFTLRSVVVYVWAVYDAPGGQFARLALVLLCHGLADAVTTRFGSAATGTTIRRFDGQKSAYEARPLLDRLGVLAMSVSQLIGIWFLLASPVADAPRVALAILLPVQGSAFTATLVRKGEIASYTGGVVYIGQLVLAISHFPWTWQAVAFVTAACVMRFRLRVNKYVMWAVLLAVFHAVNSSHPEAVWAPVARLSRGTPQLAELYDSLWQRTPGLSVVYRSPLEHTAFLSDAYRSVVQRTADLYTHGNSWLRTLLDTQ